MSQKNAKPTDGPPLSDQVHIAHLLKKYGEPLLEPCPSSDKLLLFSEESSKFSDQDFESIETHLTICLDCRDKMMWLAESEEVHTEIPLSSGSNYMLTVHHPTSDRVNEMYPMAYAAQSQIQNTEDLPVVPYISDEAGSIYGEIGQDLDHHLFLSLTHLPRIYKLHALKIRAFTFDHQVIESRSRTVTEPKFDLTCRADVHPEDLERIELLFIPLRYK
jgi:hypothetical protein